MISPGDAFDRECTAGNVDASRFVHTSFDRALADGLSSAYNGRNVTVRQKQVGQLVTKTGRLVACDPGFADSEHSKPLSRAVRPGTYPVILTIADFGTDQRNACARVQFAPGHPTRWELALEDGQNPNDLKGDESFGYGVDSGIGCFVDAAGLDALAREETYERLLGAMEVQSARGDWGGIVLEEERGLNVVAFSSGYGDGGYSSYWGFDAQNEPICLLTDFSLFLRNVESTLIVESPEVGTHISDPELETAHLRVWLSYDPEEGLALAAQGPHKASVEGRLVDRQGTVLADTRDGGSAYFRTEGDDIRANYFGCHLEGQEVKPAAPDEMPKGAYSYYSTEGEEPIGKCFGQRLDLTEGLRLEITYIKGVESL